MTFEVARSSLAALVLGSAAVGALVSSLINIVAQVVERRARQKELLLAESIKLAMAQHEASRAVAIRNNEETVITDYAVLVSRYYKALQSVFDTGDIPDNFYKSPIRK